MPSGLAAIIKKEFTRFFTDRRMVITTILMPGLLIYVIYSFMGTAVFSAFSVDEDYQPSIYAVGTPASAEVIFSQTGISVTTVPAGEADRIKQRIQGKEADLLMVFPEDFDNIIEGRGAVPAQEYRPPQVEMYFNSTRTESVAAYGTTSTLLETYKATLSPTFNINAGGLDYDLATEKDSTGFMFASLLPMLMMVFLFTGCVGVAPESIAGEKERGTIATLLVTPLRRWELALGKVVSLGAIALLAGASSFVGVMLSLPRLLGGATSDDGAALSITSLYGPTDYLLLLAVILSTVLLLVGLISVISAFARTVKEASTMVMPLMFIVMIVGALAMFSQSAQTDIWYYLIPAYNSVQCFVGVFSFTTSPLPIAVTIIVNLILTGACIFALTKMFNSEKVIFTR